MSKAVDKIGGEIRIGDKVVFMQTKYRSLLVGQVKKVTDKTVLIEHNKTNVGKTDTKQFHDQIVVIGE